MSGNEPVAGGAFLDLRFALRGLRRDRAFSLAAIVTLALTLGLNVTVFAVMGAMLFRGLPLVKRNDRLVYLAMRKPSDLPCCPGTLSYADFEDWRSQAPAFEGLAFSAGGGPIAFRAGDGRPIDVAAQRVSANTFSLLGVRPVLGRDFVAADETAGAVPVAILSYRFWESRFDKRADIVGMIVHINGAPATIVGVMPEGFALVYEQNLWLPLAHSPELQGGALGRLRDGATLQAARAELETINRRLEAADPAKNRGVPSVSTYSQAHIAPDAPISAVRSGRERGSYCSSPAPTWPISHWCEPRTMARVFYQDRAWRRPARMLRQIVVECLILSGAAGVLAWWITNWSVRTWAAATASRYLALDYTVNAGTFAYLVAMPLPRRFWFR